MIKNPIQEVTNKLQYRAIGIVKGIYQPKNIDQLNRGTLTDKEGKILETVILGKALALIKNGHSRFGDSIYFPLFNNTIVKAKIVKPIFYDPNGDKIDSI